MGWLRLKRATGTGLVFRLPDGRRVTVRVVGVQDGSRGSAHLAIDAPADVMVEREELAGRPAAPAAAG